MYGLYVCLCVWYGMCDCHAPSQVYFYDGDVKCFQDEHIPYAVISILTLVLFVIPFPLIVIAISWNYVKVNSMYVATDMKKHKA